MNKFTAEKIHEHLMNTSRAIIIPHPNPDEDALGSASAVHEYLNSLGRRASIYCATPATPRLKYLPNVPAITNDAGIFSEPDVDTIIFVDCGDPRYAGVADVIKNHPAYYHQVRTQMPLPKLSSGEARLRRTLRTGAV